MDENRRKRFLEEINKVEDSELIFLIDKIYKALNPQSDVFLQKWQEAKLIGALDQYLKENFHACRRSLELTLELKQNLSRDPKYVGLLDKNENLTLEQLIKQVIDNLKK